MVVYLLKKEVRVRKKTFMVLMITLLLAVPLSAKGGATKHSSAELTPAERAVVDLGNKLVQKIKENSPGGAVIAIVKFLNLGPDAINRKMGEIVTEMLTEELSNVTGIKLVERENLQKLLAELKLSFLGITNPRLASQVGKMLNAQYMIIGAVSDVGASYVINARIVDVATAKIVGGVRTTLNKQDVIALSSKYVVVKTKVGALYRSLILPGWGQIYSGHVVKGVFYTVTTLGLVGAALVNYYLGNNVYYNKDYKNATNTSAATKYYDKAVKSIKLGNTLLAAGAVVWVVNAVDAYVTGVNGKEVKGFETAFVPSKEGVYLGLNYKF